MKIQINFSVAYQGTGTVDYQKNYSEEDLENFYKVDNIYRPKAKFLVESLKKDKALVIILNLQISVRSWLFYKCFN